MLHRLYTGKVDYYVMYKKQKNLKNGVVSSLGFSSDTLRACLGHLNMVETAQMTKGHLLFFFV